MKLPTTDAQKETKSTFEKIADFSRKIRKDNDNIDIDDNDDVNTDVAAAGSSSTLTASGRRLKKRFYDSDGVDDEDFEEIMSDPITIIRTPGDEKVTDPDTVTKLFPKADEIKKEPEEDYESILKVQTDISELNEYDRQFFSGGEKLKKKLFDGVSKNVGIINDSNQNFLEFLTSNFGKNLLTKNKIQIHIDSG